MTDEPENEYVDAEGITWNSYERYVTVGLCGLCGWGSDAVKADIIAAIRDADVLVEVPDTSYYELILHLLDDKGLTEHGTSIYGSWLTDKGKEIRKELRRRASKA